MSEPKHHPFDKAPDNEEIMPDKTPEMNDPLEDLRKEWEEQDDDLDGAKPNLEEIEDDPSSL